MSDGKRGFAGMDPEKRRAIAQMGGQAVHAKGTAHQWTSETGRAAGRIGGSRKKKPAAAPKTVSPVAVPNTATEGGQQ